MHLFFLRKLFILQERPVSLIIVKIRYNPWNPLSWVFIILLVAVVFLLDFAWAKKNISISKVIDLFKWEEMPFWEADESL